MDGEDPTQDSRDDRANPQKRPSGSHDKKEPVIDEECFNKLLSLEDDGDKPESVSSSSNVSDLTSDSALKSFSEEAEPAPLKPIAKAPQVAEKPKSKKKRQTSKSKNTASAERKLDKEQYRRKPKKERFEELRNIRRAMLDKFKKKPKAEAEPQRYERGKKALFSIISVTIPVGFHMAHEETKQGRVKYRNTKSNKDSEEKTQDSLIEEPSTRHKLINRMERFKSNVINRFKVRKSNAKELPKATSEVPVTDIKK
uniref:SRF-dependent transcription regulation-associated protein n=1 Tax=Steinernema glaseri TaxID=37863 RepID=A0A1I7Z658_9BILA